MATVRLATRGSTLALTQTEGVAKLLRAEGHEVEVVVADSDPEVKSSLPGGDKARFVRAVERSLLEDRADIGVHSAKDLPAEVPDALEIAATPPRVDERDAWVTGVAANGDAGGRAGRGAGAGAGAGNDGDASGGVGGRTSRGAGAEAGRSIAEAPAGARVGTASLRRRSQLLALRPDLEVAELRGNVDTRLGRLAAGDYDAIVLAVAGLERLGRGEEAAFAIPAEELLPAAGQGALVLQTRRGDGDSRAAAEAIGDSRVMIELLAEREMIRALEADCDSPVGARCRHRDEELEIEAYVGAADGSEWLRDRLRGELGDPEALGRRAAERLLAAGADAILGRT